MTAEDQAIWSWLTEKWRPIPYREPHAPMWRLGTRLAHLSGAQDGRDAMFLSYLTDTRLSEPIKEGEQLYHGIPFNFAYRAVGV